MQVAARTDVGLVRETNQDRYLVWDLSIGGRSGEGRYTLCAVADGMGGSAAGDMASALALHSLCDHLIPCVLVSGTEPESGGQDWPEVLRRGVQLANVAVRYAASGDHSLEGMGTTITAGLLARGVLYLAQVGDSRCYLLRSAVLEQQTSDHSLVAELVRLGKLTSDQARKHPRRNVITRAIGAADTVNVEVTSHAVQEDDLFLFCSDGLWEMAPDAQLHAILSRGLPGKGSSPQGPLLATMAERLIQCALDQGGEDNVTVALALVEKDDVHPDAIYDAQVFARTRVESAASHAADLKQTLRFRLQEWQQD